jgi:hypothetical protein
VEDKGMAKTAKFYPVLPHTKKSHDSLYGGKQAGKSNKQYGTYYGSYEAWSDGVTFVPLTYHGPGTTQNGLDSASYTNNPGWRVAIAKGGDVTSGYSRTIWRLGTTNYSVYATNQNGRITTRGSGSAAGSLYAVVPPPAIAQKVDAAAAGRLRHRLDGYIGNAQLAAPLAESREIHRLVRQINSLGMDTLKAMLAIKKTKGKSLSKLLGQTWLGFGFGVNPLLHDIQKAADSILKYTTRQDQRVRVVGTASDDWVASSKNGYGYSVVAYGTNMGFFHYSKHVLGVQYIAGIDLQTRTAANYGVTDHLGLKIEDLPGTLWELTAFSWVFDYVATVQPWLEDMFYVLPGVCKYVSKSTKYQCETTSTPYFEFPANFSMKGAGSGGSAISRHVDFTRTRLTGLPTRGLRIKTADEIASHGLTKMLNLASVIAGKHGPNLS